MTINLAGWCGRVRRAFGSRYVRLIEDELARERDEVTRQHGEIERLRAENRALINSLLGTAGIPPIDTGAPQAATVLPVRRSSWTQIAAAREIEAAREVRAKQRVSARSEEPQA